LTVSVSTPHSTIHRNRFVASFLQFDAFCSPSPPLCIVVVLCRISFASSDSRTRVLFLQKKYAPSRFCMSSVHFGNHPQFSSPSSDPLKTPYTDCPPKISLPNFSNLSPFPHFLQMDASLPIMSHRSRFYFVPTSCRTPPPT